MKGTTMYAIRKVTHPVILLLFILIVTCPVMSQQISQAQPDIRQIQPGLYAAGVPSDEFEYFAAPQSSGRQRQTNWCWAASIQMVLNYHGINASQEEIVARCFGELVDRPGQPADILGTLNGWGMQAATAVLSLSNPRLSS